MKLLKWFFRVFLVLPLWVIALIALLVGIHAGSSISATIFGFSIFGLAAFVIEMICQRHDNQLKEEIINGNYIQTEMVLNEDYVQAEKVLNENHVAAEKSSLPNLKEKINLLIREFGEDIPLEALTKVMNIKENILRLLPDLEKMNPVDYELHTVIHTISDYLPTTLMTYSELPKDFAENYKVKGKIPQDILMEQLDILDEQIQKIVADVNSKNADSLIIQGEFLKSKFLKNEL